MSLPRGLAPASGPDEATWLLDGLSTREHTVRSLVPDVFEAYCRVFHPAGFYDVEDGRATDRRRVSWGEIAEMNGRVMHAEAQFEAITGLDRYRDQSAMDRGQPPLWRTGADEGSLDRETLEELLPVLRSHTTSPERCYFAHWGGFGWLKLDTEGIPFFGYPWPNTGRDHFLLEGPIESCLVSLNEQWFQSPNVWWPDDHAWVVATDIDLDSTYIGGTRACTANIVEHPSLEALPTKPDHVVTRDGDKLNPPLQAPR